LPRVPVGLGCLVFSFLIELGQCFQLVELLGLGHLAWARVVLGTFCDARDFVAYTLALPLIALGERIAKTRSHARQPYSGRPRRSRRRLVRAIVCE